MSPPVKADAGLSAPPLLVAVLLSGACGLTWEVLWQHHTALSLGVSAYGAAVTLSAVMAGLGIGGWLAGRLASTGRLRRPLVAYGVAEIVVGVTGALVPIGLDLVAALDTATFESSPAVARLVELVGTHLVLIVPAAAMGTTIPLLAPAARDSGKSLATYYALNTLGACGGVLLATFVAFPALGVRTTSFVAAGVNLAVGLWAIAHPYRGAFAPAAAQRAPARRDMAIAFTTGAIVFALEVCWFRSLRAAFQSSTETFAIVLAGFLLSLSVGAAVAPRLARRRGALEGALAFAGAAVLCATPFIDGVDRWVGSDFYSAATPLRRLGGAIGLFLVPVGLVGTVFPMLLSRNDSTKGAGRLYAANTVGAVVGALGAGYLLLPAIGATLTAWCLGVGLVVAAMGLSPRPRFMAAAVALAACGLAVAGYYESGTARERVHGFGSSEFRGVLYVAEGPDSTVWVTENRRFGFRQLVIDGFVASGEGEVGEHYMPWMGHLPALAVPRPRRALVICFGTGRTAHAVRRHRPERLDIAELSPAVLAAADLFSMNEGVLDDPRVHATVMDGRAFLRRSRRTYDLITLEPMPPNSSGANNLYSREFYELARARLGEEGVAAQWLPMHILAPSHMRAILATFVDVFPQARLWIDPRGGTGIVVGGRRSWRTRRSDIALDLDADAIEAAYLLGPRELAALSRGAPRITDDNQLLSYGLDRLTRSASGRQWFRRLYLDNLEILRSYASSGAR